MLKILFFKIMTLMFSFTYIFFFGLLVNILIICYIIQYSISVHIYL